MRFHNKLSRVILESFSNFWQMSIDRKFVTFCLDCLGFFVLDLLPELSEVSEILNMR